MVGPSGCGKTTTLRMIAGFERPTSGRILLDGDDVAQTPPHRRNVNTVFQSYALFPHLNVADNVAFGLKYKTRHQGGARASGSARRSRWCSSRATRRASPDSSRAASSSASRWPARSCCDPRVLLLDEPLGALDARLRKDLQVELKALQGELGITFVFVTHDQEEALTMSDRVAVMNGGPRRAGGPAAGDLRGAGDAVRRRLPRRLEPRSAPRPRAGDGERRARSRSASGRCSAQQGAIDARGPVKAMIRPERVRVEAQGDGRARTACRAWSSTSSSSAASASCACGSSAATS